MISDMQRILGHSSLYTTRDYVNLNDADIRVACEKASSRFPTHGGDNSATVLPCVAPCRLPRGACTTALTSATASARATRLR